MAYLGKPAGNRATGTSKDSFNGDGSTTAFTMTKTVHLVTDIEVFVDNVQQEPTTAYTVSATTLTFDEAPPNGTANVYVIHRSGNNDSMTIQSGITPTFQNVIIANNGNIGSAGDSDAIAINSSGRVTLSNNLTVDGTTTVGGILKTDDTTEATSTTDGSLQTDGGLSVAKDAVIGDDLKLLSDSSVVSLGADSDVTITHNHNTGVTLNSMDISGVISINGGQIGGSRNYIYNGDTSICQRATSVSGVGDGDTGYHVQDRWGFVEAGSPATVVTMSRATEVPNGFQYSLKLDCTTASGTVGSDDLVLLQQIFEGQDLYAWKKGTADALPVTLSFWVNATKTGTYIVNLFDNDNTRVCSKSYTVSSSDTWEYKTITFPADTTGVFDRNNGASLYVYFGLVAGSDYTSGTLQETWAANDNTNRFVGQVDAFDNTSNNFHITGIQLELGETASLFQNETYGENLARCQRYFYKGEDLVYGTHHYGSGDGGAGYAVVWFPVTMRADPTVTGVNSNSTAQQVSKDKIDCYRVGNYPSFDAGHTADAEL